MSSSFNLMLNNIGPASGRIRDPVIATIRRLGLSSGLQLCLDAGDSQSYSSGQTWNDLSGNGNHMWRGSGSGSDAGDPTFNGTAGGNTVNEYFSFDGGDFFTLSIANPAWVNDFFKNNALGTVATMARIATTVGANSLGGQFGTVGGTWFWVVNPNDTLGMAMYDDGGVQRLSIGAGGTSVTLGAWNHLLVAFDEAAGSHYLRKNASNENASGTNAAPGTTDSNSPFMIGKAGSSGTTPIENGGRIAYYLTWNRKLSATEADTLFHSLRHKYGI